VGRIRILPDAVANKIAAGEVVERPASVVKELVENSLDAGASEIRVEIEQGGRRLIRVTDDGCGMMRDDAMLAFERHATSKLSDVKDLFSIATLGFRGEALPSIAAVSRLELVTKTAAEQVGTRVELAGGKLLRCDDAATTAGTSITVRDLFFNVPARRKFLRSEQTEVAHIAALVTHYSLAHPDKGFELIHDGRPLLEVTPVAAAAERVFQVFGSQTFRDLVELAEVTAQAEERCYRLSGFISQPQIQKLNRNSIYVFVNRRPVRDRLILHAISAAYHNVIPASAYPFALLFLDCDPEEVDVNVHPSKTEVRFRRGSFVHDFIRDAVRAQLAASRPASSVPVGAIAPPQPAAALPFSEFTQQIEEARLGEPPSEAPAGEIPEQIPEFTLRPQPPPAPRLDFGSRSLPLEEPPPAPLKLKVPDTHGALPEGALMAEGGSLAGLGDLRPLGQLHNSFIIAAGRDGLWIIDQHVAHERILFERILQQQAAGRIERQQLLMPLVIELTPAQWADYERIAGELETIGFEIEPFGPRALAVQTAPAAIGAGDIEKVIFEILEIADSQFRRLSPDDLRRAMAASLACRAAIKINTPLDDARIAWLLGALAKTECPMSCPHGRPIALRYSTRDLLKSFHRI
jgi:DNA mismatch repair protein MutL